MNKKKVLSVILSLVTALGIFAGCADSETLETKIEDLEGGGSTAGAEEADQEQKMGRFVEADIQLPVETDKIYCLGMTADHTLTAYAEDENGDGHLMASGDLGESWENVDVAGMRDAYIVGGGVLPEGGMALVGVFMEDGDYYSVKKIAPDGNVTTVQLNLPEGDTPYQAGVDAAGRVFAQSVGGGIFSVDTESGACAGIGEGNDDASYFALAGEKMLLITDQGILVNNTADGSRQPQDAVLDDIIKSDAALARRDTDRAFPVVFNAGVEEGSIVYANHQGVYYHQNGGSMAEQLVNGELSTLGDTSGSLHEIVMPDEEHFMMHLSDQINGERIVRFSYDKTVSAVPENELKVYSLYDSSLLRQAVSLYQKQNPGSYVHVEIGMDGAEGITAEDAIAALNTKILAEDGPDVLILDDLPVDSYIEKGILADISGLVQQLEDKEGLMTNISDCYKKDGACYELPARFAPLMVVGDEGAIEASKNISDYAEYINRLAADGEEKVILPRNAATHLKMMYLADGSNWLSGDGNLDTEKLKEWLTAAKKIYDANSEEENEENSSRERFENYLVSTFDPESLSMGYKTHFGTNTDIMNYVMLMVVQKETGCSYGLFNNGSGNRFVPYLSVGISSTSEAVEEAEAFFMTLFGSECSTGTEGFPINRTGYQEVCAEAREQYGADSLMSIGFSTPDGEQHGYELNTFDEAAEMEFNTFIESLSLPAARSGAAWEIIENAAEAYLKGSSSLEDTAAEIGQKLSLYLSE